MRLLSASIALVVMACGARSNNGPDGGTAHPCKPSPPLPTSRYCATPWFPDQVTVPGMPITEPGGGNSQGRFALGDLDADGHLDAIATADGSAVYTFFGSRHGVWPTPQKSDAPADARDLSLGDLDGNGTRDVVVVSWPLSASTGQVVVLLNNGSGALVHGAALATEQRSTRVIVADTNADGRQDIIVAAATSVQVFRNQGSMTFAAPLSYTTGTDFYAYPEALDVGDINNDGRLDIVAAYYAGDVYVLAGRANGSFGPATHYTLPFSPPSIVLADVTGDGTPELIAAGRGTGLLAGVEVLANAGTGAFSTPVQYSVADFNQGLAVADIDADGDRDIVIAGLTGTSILPNAGNGTFGAEQAHDGSAHDVVVADVDGDGNQDLVLYSTGLSTLLGNGDGSFIESMPAPLWRPDVVTDMNHDGLADLVGVASDPREIAVMLSNGDTTFRPALSYYRPLGSPMSVADIDGDDNLDVLMTGAGTIGIPGQLIVMRGRGDGTLAPAETYAASAPGTMALAVGDVNGDCKPDVALASNGATAYDRDGNVIAHDDGSTDLLLNNGDGTFGAPHTFAETSQAVRIGDINSDDNADAFVSIAGQTVSFVADGVGGFTGRVDRGADIGALIDVNHDGHLDLIRLSSTALGRGDGSFEPPIETETPYTGSWGDIDGDGNIDGTYGSLFLGHGDGTFARREGDFGAIADLNGDGYADSISNRILLQRCW